MTRPLTIGVWSLDHMHARSYLGALGHRQDVSRVLLTDEGNPDKACAIAAETGAEVCGSSDEMLSRVDAVVITSANADHCAMALAAARAGVHALVEKPIATNVADAARMIDAYEQAGLVLGTAFPCPFGPAFQALQERIAAGDLGAVLAFRCTNRGSMPGGFFIQLERSGGGAVIDHTVHVADLLRRLTGGPAVSVHAEVGHGLFHQGWDDSGLLNIEMPGGVWATLDCSWSRSASYPIWGDVTLKVIGTRATAEVDLFGQRLEHYPAAATPGRWLGWGTDLDALMIDDFLDAVRQGRPPVSTGADGLHALQVALAAYRSAREGGPVGIDSVTRPPMEAHN